MALPNNLVYPKARLRLLNAAYRPSAKLVALNRVNFHITASEATSQFAYFNSAGRASSHLHLDRAGNWEQYQYLDLRSEADLDGNDATWSVETQGASGPWTEAQVVELAEFFKWARSFGVANKLATSSKIGDESKGLSWHRQGIDGNFPPLPSILAGRLQRGGGMHYSQAVGKTCPTDACILQIPRIFALSQDATAPTPVEDDMLNLIKITGPNGKKAVLGDIIGWVDTSPPGVTEFYVAICNALGFSVTEKTLDENGWAMAQAFKFPGVVPPLPPATVDVNALAAALAPLINEGSGVTPADIIAIAETTVQKMPKTLS